MNKLAKEAIVAGRSLHFVQDTTFAGYPLAYPLLAVKKCHYEVSVSKIGDYAEADYQIRASLTVSDSRDAVPFSKNVAFEEAVDLLEEEDTAGEGFVIPGNEVDLDELALRLIVSSLPIRLVRSEKIALPKSGKGYRVLSEDEKAEEAEEKGDPRLAGLDSIKIDK